MLYRILKKSILEERYFNIVDFIMNNTRMSYDDSKLVIDNGDLVLEYIRVIERQKYEERYEKLKGDLKF